MHRPAPLTSERWMRQVFSAKAPPDGGVVQRNLCDIDRIVGRAAFEAELRRRGYRAVESAGQVIIFCNRDPARILR